METEGSSSRASLLLGIGAAIGLALAAADLVERGTERATLPDGSAARVGHSLIRLDDYERAVNALASDRRSPLGPPEKRHVLGRLVDEELLVQRGLELGLARRDRRVRADLVSAVIDAVTSEAKATEPTASEVEAFYAENRDYFTRPGRIRARQVLIRAGRTRSDAEASERAADATAALTSGVSFQDVRSRFGDQEIAPLPDALLPITKIREYLGPTAARALLETSTGAWTDPIRSSSGYHVLQVTERTPDEVPTLSSIEKEVRSEVRRRNADDALRSYLDDLRDSGEVHLRESLFE